MSDPTQPPTSGPQPPAGGPGVPDPRGQWPQQPRQVPGFQPPSYPGPGGHPGPAGHPGGPVPGAYAPAPQPGKKSSLPKILAIAAGGLALLIGLAVVFFMFAFRAPTMPEGRTGKIFDPPGLQVGSRAVTKSRPVSSPFSGTDPCSTRLREAAKDSDSLVTGDGGRDVSVLVGRTRDAKGADRIFDAYDSGMRGCTQGRVRISPKGANIGNAQGVTYKQFQIEQSSDKPIDLLLMKYGNTWALVSAAGGVIDDPAEVATSYAGRMKAAAR